MTDQDAVYLPHSALTIERPDIWHRGVELATSLTGVRFAPKPVFADGGIIPYNHGHKEGLSCYGSYRSNREVLIDDLRNWREHLERLKKRQESDPKPAREAEIERASKTLKELEEYWGEQYPGESPPKADTVRIHVPDGALEWLLHEVGHWLVATTEERQRTDWGLGDTSDDGFGRGPDCEWRAWCFEAMVLSPFGNARLFASPTQRDGVAFARSGPLPVSHAWHVEQAVRELGIDLEPWRLVWGEWVRWGRRRGAGRAPWEAL